MTVKQLQGQGMSNLLQTIIAGGVLWMCASINGLMISDAEQSKDINHNQHRIIILEARK